MVDIGLTPPLKLPSPACTPLQQLLLPPSALRTAMKLCSVNFEVLEFVMHVADPLCSRAGLLPAPAAMQVQGTYLQF